MQKKIKLTKDNSWIKNGNLWDLTRSDRAPVTTPYKIPCNGKRKEMLIEPSRSALVIIDMQSLCCL
jgi:hypothetical protein